MAHSLLRALDAGGEFLGTHSAELGVVNPLKMTLAARRRKPYLSRRVAEGWRE